MSTDPVQRVTTARRSHSQEMSGRVRVYAISMGVRTACVIGFVIMAVLDHWTKWLFVPAAVLLPYVAVLLANAGRERMPAPPPAYLGRPELPEAPPAGLPR